MSDYNGWKNRATWNVALWVGNDYSLYQEAVSYAKRSPRPSWAGFVTHAGLRGKTPDGIAWNSKTLDRRALSGMLRDMKRDGG